DLVTGVQTCALPISADPPLSRLWESADRALFARFASYSTAVSPAALCFLRSHANFLHQLHRGQIQVLPQAQLESVQVGDGLHRRWRIVAFPSQRETPSGNQNHFQA